MLQFFAKHHNKIQFFGYEVANLVLVAQQLWLTDGSGYGLNAETLAALSLLLGSALIWRFDPKLHPHLLFYGGLALIWGGVFLAAAGYVWNSQLRAYAQQTDTNYPLPNIATNQA